LSSVVDKIKKDSKKLRQEWFLACFFHYILDIFVNIIDNTFDKFYQKIFIVI
jgi:hypothetical protein